MSNPRDKMLDWVEKAQRVNQQTSTRIPDSQTRSATNVVNSPRKVKKFPKTNEKGPTKKRKFQGRVRDKLHALGQKIVRDERYGTKKVD